MERVHRRPRRGPGVVPTDSPAANVHPVLALQRSAGNRAVAGLLARQLREDSALDEVETADDKLSGNAVALDTLVKAVTEEEIGFEGQEEAIRDALAEYATNGPPDLAYPDVESVVAWLAVQGIVPADSVNPNAGGIEESSEDEAEQKPQAKQRIGKRDDKLGKRKKQGGEWIGQMHFEGQSWHKLVKPAVVSGITKERLRKLAKDADASNWNFWIAKNGDITFGPNSTLTSRGKETGFRLRGKPPWRTVKVEMVEDLLANETADK
jgi:hypothetical protein